MDKWLSLTLLILIATLCIPQIVGAHAYLDRSIPVQESGLEESPREIRVKFTEPIDTNVSKLTLKTENGELIEAEQYSEENIWLVLDIPQLQDGIYHVYWQVLALDTHITDGSFRFSVGVELPPHRPADTVSLDELMNGQVEESNPFNWNKLFRTIDVLLITSIAGLFFFTHWLMNGKSNTLSTRIEVSIYLTALVLFLLTGFGHLYIRAVQFTDGTWIDIDFWRIMGVLSISTIIGTVSLLRPILIVIFLIFVIKSNSKWMPSFILLGLIFTYPITGHAIQYNMIISHFFHLIAASIWFGGLLGLLIYTFKLEVTHENLLLLHNKIKRFSVFALIMVLVVSITGSFLSVTYLQTWESFTTHEYGTVLVWKIAFFILSLIIACFHRFVWFPKLLITNEKNKRTLNILIWAIRLELLTAFIVIIIAGILSTTSPPVNSYEHHFHDSSNHEHHDH